MWKGRKSAFAAVGRISPAYFVQDGVIPRPRLPEVLAGISRLASSLTRLTDPARRSRTAPDGRFDPLALLRKEYVHVHCLPAGL